MSPGEQVLATYTNHALALVLPQRSSRALLIRAINDRLHSSEGIVNRLQPQVWTGKRISYSL